MAHGGSHQFMRRISTVKKNELKNLEMPSAAVVSVVIFAYLLAPQRCC